MEMTLAASVGAVKLDKYQTIAAVDADGEVTRLATLLIKRLLAGIITEFSAGDCFYY